MCSGLICNICSCIGDICKKLNKNKNKETTPHKENNLIHNNNSNQNNSKKEKKILSNNETNSQKLIIPNIVTISVNQKKYKDLEEINANKKISNYIDNYIPPAQIKKTYEKYKVPILNYEIEHKQDKYIKVPTYIDKKDEKIFGYNFICNNKSAFSNQINDKVPIIIVNNEEIKEEIIKFLNSYYKYKDYWDLDVLLNKLLIANKMPHKHKYYSYLEISDILNKKIYDKDVIKNITNKLKEKSDAFNQNFNTSMENLVITVFNCVSEYLLFKKKYKPYYSVCNNCKYPIIYCKKPFDKENNNINNNINDEDANNFDYLKYNNKFGLIYSLPAAKGILNLAKNEEAKCINVLYYYNDKEHKKTENEINNYINKFEDATDGIFISASSFEKFESIIKLIADENKKKSKFELILDLHEKNEFNFDFLIDNNYMKFFNNIFILTNNINNFSRIDENLSIRFKFCNTIMKVVNFLNSCSRTSNPFKCNELLSFKKYKKGKKKLHRKIAANYGNFCSNSFTIAYGIISDFLEVDNANDLQIKTYDNTPKAKRESLLNVLKVFEDLDKNNIKNFENIIHIYTKSLFSFYQDFNKWLRELDELAYDKIGYFIAGLMYSLNSYGEERNKGVKNNLILYRGLSLNYIDLSFYEMYLNKVIILPSFTSTTTNKSTAINFMGYGDNYSVLYKINYNFKNGWYPCAFDISSISEFSSESERLFQPFSFFKITKVDIDTNNKKAEIEMENVGKKCVLEKEIQKGKELEYDASGNFIYPYMIFERGAFNKTFT